MKKSSVWTAIMVFVVMFAATGCGTKTVELWNGKNFNGWEMVLADETADAKTVWTAKDGVLHCTGVPNGYIRTKSDYANYTLLLEWRWVEKESNSGVLLHAQEPDRVWPLAIECQLKAGNAGDFVLMGPGSITVDGQTYKNEERFLRIPKKHDSNENPAGEWNQYKIISRNGEITCFVNGLLQNHGKNASPASGKICLQSEGAPIEFRNIRLIFDQD